MGGGGDPSRFLFFLPGHRRKLMSILFHLTSSVKSFLFSFLLIERKVSHLFWMFVCNFFFNSWTNLLWDILIGFFYLVEEEKNDDDDCCALRAEMKVFRPLFFYDNPIYPLVGHNRRSPSGAFSFYVCHSDKWRCTLLFFLSKEEERSVAEVQERMEHNSVFSTLFLLLQGSIDLNSFFFIVLTRFAPVRSLWTINKRKGNWK